MKYYYDGLRDAYALVNENQIKKSRLLKPLKEYSGYRTTASGNRVRRDEPNADLELRQSDAIRASELKRKAAASREALKKKGAVPTKKGAKLFEEFMKETRFYTEQKESKMRLDDAKQIYLSAQSLDFDKWILFVTEML
jgi:hypothetical protein